MGAIALEDMEQAPQQVPLEPDALRHIREARMRVQGLLLEYYFGTDFDAMLRAGKDFADEFPDTDTRIFYLERALAENPELLEMFSTFEEFLDAVDNPSGTPARPSVH